MKAKSKSKDSSDRKSKSKPKTKETEKSEKGSIKKKLTKKSIKTTSKVDSSAIAEEQESKSDLTIQKEDTQNFNLSKNQFYPNQPPLSPNTPTNPNPEKCEGCFESDAVCYCKDCNKFFSKTTGTLYHRSENNYVLWKKFIECEINGLTLAQEM